MALGDYSKTTYVNGTAPGLSAINMNNNENKVAELDTSVEAIYSAQTTHIANTANPHGAVTTATASKLALRDASGYLYSKNSALYTDGVWAMTENKAGGAINSGSAITSATIIENQGLYLLFVTSGQTGTAGDCGIYSVYRITTTVIIDNIVTLSNMAVTLDGSYHVVVTNNLGAAVLMHLALIQVVQGG